MKHLLNGIAIAVVLAIATPALAQAPAKPTAPSAAKPMAMKKPMMKKHRRAHAGDAMTEQLNKEELARIQGGGAPPPPAAAAPMPAPERMPGPKASGK
jgi:hypothetical protein